MIQLKLKNCCNFIDYRGKTPEKSKSGYRLITAKNVKDEGFSLYPEEYIPIANYEKIMTRGIPKINDILFTTEAPLGNVCRIPSLEEPFAIGQRIIVIQPNKQILISEYLELILKSNDFRKKLLRKSSGSTVKGIRSKELVEIEIKVPCLKKQHDIVAKADLLKKIINNKNKILESLDNLIKSRFVEMFGEFKDVSTIGEICILKSGQTFNKNLELDCGDIMYAKVSDMNLHENELYIMSTNKYVSKETSANYIIPKGAILFPKRGGAIKTNKKRIAQKDMCVDLNIMAVIPGEKILSSYLFQYFQNIDMSSICDGSSVPQINNRNISPLEIFVPPKDQQEIFDAFFNQVNKSKFILFLSIQMIIKIEHVILNSVGIRSFDSFRCVYKKL